MKLESAAILFIISLTVVWLIVILPYTAYHVGFREGVWTTNHFQSIPENRNVPNRTCTNHHHSNIKNH